MPGLIAGSVVLAGCALALWLDRTPARVPHECLPLRGRWLRRLLNGGLFVGGGVAVVSAPDLLCPAIVIGASLVITLAMLALVVFGLCLLLGGLLRGIVDVVPALVARPRNGTMDRQQDCSPQ